MRIQTAKAETNKKKNLKRVACCTIPQNIQMILKTKVVSIEEMVIIRPAQFFVLFQQSHFNISLAVTIKGLIYLFGHFMDTCDDIHLMSALIDGFGLLILHGLYVDEKLVSRLILLYFNPTTEAEINQILSIFFETLIHQKKQECLEAALIQTLTKIIEASSESPLHEVKIETVLKFIISSTLPLYCKTGEYNKFYLFKLIFITNRPKTISRSQNP